MRQLIFKLIALVALNVALALGIQAWANARLHFQPWETDSVLLTLPRDTQFDYLLMGTSRTKPLTRIQCNFETLQRELGGSVQSVALPFGGGIVPAKLMLQSFFDRGNRAKTIIYCIDPFVFYAHVVNKQHRFVYYEPLDLRLLARMVLNRIPAERILIYIQSKFRYDWFGQEPAVVSCYHEPIHDPSFDQTKIKARMDILYQEGLRDDTFDHYAPELGRIIDIGQKHGCRFVFVLAPTLLGDEPGKPRAMELVYRHATQYGYPVYDFTNETQDLALYSDYDHLNSEGVRKYITEFLKPAVR